MRKKTLLLCKALFVTHTTTKMMMNETDCNKYERLYFYNDTELHINIIITNNTNQNFNQYRPMLLLQMGPQLKKTVQVGVIHPQECIKVITVRNEKITFFISRKTYILLSLFYRLQTSHLYHPWGSLKKYPATNMYNEVN